MADTAVKEKKAKAKTKTPKAEKIILDAEGCTLGRIAAFAAKQALKGNNVVIFNAEKAVISGKTDYHYADYKKRFNAKNQANPWRYGPKRPKVPDRFVRRAIRGMLPWDRPKGQAAFKKIMVYMGRPVREIMKREHFDLAKATLADNSKFKKHYDYSLTVAEICNYLGTRKE